MRTLLCFLLLISTAFAEDVVELRFDGQKWLMDGVELDQAAMDKLSEDPKDLALKATGETKMKHFNKLLHFWVGLGKGDLLLRCGDRSERIEREPQKAIEKFAQNMQRLQHGGAADAYPSVFAIYGKSICYAGGLVDKSDDENIGQVYMHIDGRGVNYFSNAIKQSVKPEPDVAKLFLTSDATLYGDYFQAWGKLRKLGIKRALPAVEDALAVLVLPMVLVEEDIVSPEVNENKRIRIQLNGKGEVRDAHDKLLENDEAVRNYMRTENINKGKSARLEIIGERSTPIEHMDRLLQLADDVGIKDVVAGIKGKTEDQESDVIAEKKVPEPIKAEDKKWIPEKADFGDLDLKKLDIRPRESDLPMTLPRGEEKKQLDAVDVKISIEAKGVAINGKFHGLLNKEQHKAASEQLQALKETGVLMVSLKAADDAPQPLVVDVLNLLVGLEINKVTFVDADKE